ncbi:hypothetical protein Lal_00045867 [Lupinus albus]|uniref:Putative HSP20-like chaperone n=1 Tax=Lupinus albus TaxID=3870 RepID=A0A6A5NFX9_LUPAL|nr:putative HSP20-like chaperone [Lupinus albus]KAF1886634.1 hypothetical protein Lal_00045867 [Lupinus albus]
METIAAAVTGQRLYEDFEPFCKWITQEGEQTLEIDLKGFNREQLKVQTNNKGFLTIYGEKAVDGASSKWNRFQKEIKLSKDIRANEISAKFSHGILSIIMPKMVKAAAKENIKEAGLEATQQAKDSGIEKHYILGLKTTKRRAIEVAFGVFAVMAVVVAIGTYYVTQLGNRYDDVNKLG